MARRRPGSQLCRAKCRERLPDSYNALRSAVSDQQTAPENLMIHVSVRPSALPGLLSDVPDTVRYLSLDCFDTLLWRAVHAPIDVFADLPIPGATEARVLAEQAARRHASMLHRRGDVTLDEIHAALLPDSRAAERAALMNAELEAEARHCYIFAPTRDLIVDAKRRGLKVIVVSDTYLTEARLRTLIDRAGGRDVLAMIDHVFCSCDHGMGKSQGLFRPVVAKLGVAASEILHVGDNPVADQQAAAEVGMHTVHLVQFDDVAEQRLRQESCAAAMMEPTNRAHTALIQAHRPQIALRENAEPHAVLGHDVLGPIMHGFAVWLREETDALERASGTTVKMLFLLRDGHMPAQACAALYPEWRDRIIPVEISRFTSTAASFVDPAAIQRYLLDTLGLTGDYALLARQLLFDEDEQKRLATARTDAEFAKKIALPVNREKILKRSAGMARRLRAHLHARGVEDGDTVMLVDLGYNGSVQNAVEPVLRASMKLDICGRYLSLCEKRLSGLDKKGMFDLRNHDTHALRALYHDISILEQMCTVSQGSVMNYKPDGTPVRGEIGLDAKQSSHRDAIQAGCRDYLQNVGKSVVAPAASADAEGWRRTAMGVLSRLLYLPSAAEVEILSDFHMDVNMGTKINIAMLDTAAAEDGMRRRGLIYIKNNPRIFLAGELRRQGMPLSLAMMAISRFWLDVRKADFDVGEVSLPVVLLDGGSPIEVAVDAYPTTDGYYRAIVPIGPRRYSVGLQFGLICDVVQIEELAFEQVDTFMAKSPVERLIPAVPIVDDMTEIASGLYHAAGPQAFILVPPPAPRENMDGDLILSVVFRPVVRTAAAVEQRQVA
ncbi:HAD family hydrolase [Sphingomonas sp. M6A6_1c]